MAKVTVTSEQGLAQSIDAAGHTLVADEPVSAGGANTGPDPYALLLASLGACTSMTLRLYAARKRWPLEGVVVELEHARVHADDCADCEGKSGLVDQITRKIELVGPLDDEQKKRLADIATKCPVHKTLTAGVVVRDTITTRP
ncbi:OsmC family protein [Myxococcota bacterium]|nr:OsmC family protein [Myxococcota bacterium]